MSRKLSRRLLALSASLLLSAYTPREKTPGAQCPMLLPAERTLEEN